MQRTYTTELETMNQTLEEKIKNLIKVLDVSTWLVFKRELEELGSFFCFRKPLLRPSTVRNA